MPKSPPPEPAVPDALLKGFLGFFGMLLGLFLLPRAFTFFVRRFVLGTIGEIVTIVVAGLLTEKAVDLISKDDQK